MGHWSTPVGGSWWVVTNAMRLFSSAALAGIQEHHVRDPGRRYVANENGDGTRILGKETHYRLRCIIEARRVPGTEPGERAGTC